MQFLFESPVSFSLAMKAERKRRVSLEKSIILYIHTIVYVCILSEPDPRQHYCKAAPPTPIPSPLNLPSFLHFVRKKNMYEMVPSSPGGPDLHSLVAYSSLIMRDTQV